METPVNLRRNAVFAASLCLFVIPPLFAGSVPARAFSSWTFPIKPLCYAVLAFVLVRFSFPPSTERTQHNAFRFVQTGWAIASFGSLCVIASVVELAVRFSGGTTNLYPALPSSIAETFFCIANFACASFYEEAIYRLYLPETLGAILKDVFLKSKKWKKRAQATVQISETLSVAAFALSHRYLGLPSVVNAFFAGIVLRICCKKSGTLWTNTAAHFAYNMLSLVLFAHMQ
ncbi:CPBP family intramembrane glutamic endopeptidase [Treponema sp. Marseille-Q4130]|uniref:CPBP family intramembrane glutamic endopeptidase n=1 Tax=Treponema sp. Marseille-Q4130 TaxID=2766702 RepID=UPI001651F651|nr:CPBP family intramembrane glutamic endopeptidase [Treponema sp. Marseille-Q4130]MBC6719431.1 CPBP family intramembrane metalloprotease [Treponema sp. Marseille-Q4130]